MITKKPRKRVPFEKKTISKMVYALDEPFSKYIRLRDSERVDDDFIGQCITCSKKGIVAYFDDDGKLRFNTGWDNGHFVGRGTWRTRFEEENCNLQCSFRCNKMNSGEYQKYKSALKSKYGNSVPDELEKLAEEFPSSSYRFSREELIQLRDSCKEYIEWQQNN